MENKKRRKRNGKFYSKNEKKVMELYGLKATPMSGAGWLIKEDGQNENIIAQLKSTDYSSYKINLDDIDKLEYHALVENKIPLFIIEFLQRDERYFLIKPQNLYKLSNLLECKEYKSDGIINELNIENDEINKENENGKIKIVSSLKAKEKFYKELEKERERKNEKFRKSKLNEKNNK